MKEKKLNDKIKKRRADPALEEALKENEKKANALCTHVFFFLIMVYVIALVLNSVGVFKMGKSMIVTVLTCIILLLAPIVFRRIGMFSSGTIKRLVIACSITAVTMMDITEGYNVSIAIVLPVFLSALYFDQVTVVVASVITTVVFGIETFAFAFNPMLLDVNHVPLDDGTVLVIKDGLRNTILENGYDESRYAIRMMLLSYLPKIMALVVIVATAFAVTKYGQEMLRRQAEHTAEQTRVNTELAVARELQENSLPDAAELSRGHSFDLAAKMSAARETGGDFYDFVMLDKSHLALVIGDVSDKGIPAAMFMMDAKARINSAISTGKRPSEILSEVNEALCADNRDEMFVTVWLGIVDLENGTMISANAGHQNPVMCFSGGEYTEIIGEHDLFLGEFPDVKFTDLKDEFSKGDVLMLFTDGVTDMRNPSDEVFGSRRLIECLNSCCRDKNLTSEEIMGRVNDRLADFAEGEEQFDDVTMMVFRL